MVALVVMCNDLPLRSPVAVSVPMARSPAVMLPAVIGSGVLTLPNMTPLPLEPMA